MLETILLDRALCLPAVDIAALLSGQLIAVISQVSIQKGWIFALYPTEADSDLSLEKQYRSHILPLIETTVSEQQTGIKRVAAWARCEHYKVIHAVEQSEALSHLTIWTKEALKQSIEQRQHLFVALLRVYRIPTKTQVSVEDVPAEKFGKFVSLSTLTGQPHEVLNIKEMLPVLNDSVFEQRKHQIEELRPPLYPELEELQYTVACLTESNVQLQSFNLYLQKFLGWTNETSENHDPDLQWISTIADVGNSSDGDGFEKLVRKSLIKLGFSNSLNNPKASLDPDGMGGAGGLDVYCTDPYPLVGECKATKNETVSNGVSAQLINLGNTHLGAEQFNKSLKVLFVAGNLTAPAEKAAVGNQMNVMRPETLQKLVELKSKYPGSINLMELETCLKKAPFGEESNNKIFCFIEQTEQQIKTRSDLVKSVKLLTRPDRKHLEVGEICTCYNLKFADNSSQELGRHKAHELLIELSSPLTGYLGRIAGVTGMETDRFYFLRDLKID